MNQFNYILNKQVNEDYLKCLLANNQLCISKKNKQIYTNDFRSILKIQEIKKNYMLLGFFVGLVISIYFLFMVFKNKKNETVFFYFFMIGIAIFISFTLGFLGSKITRGQKQISGNLLIEYVFDKLIFWTFKTLQQTNDINERRFLLENLMNSLFDFVQYKQLKLWDTFSKDYYLKKIFQNKKNEQAIFLSIKIFLIIFIDDNHKLNSNGAIILSKIYQPILYLSNNQNICQLIDLIQKKFKLDNKINPFEYQYVDCYKKQEIKIDVNKSYFDDYVVFYMFPTFWELLCNDQFCKSYCKSSSYICQKNLLDTIRMQQQNSYIQNSQVQSIKSLVQSTHQDCQKYLNFSDGQNLKNKKNSSFFFIPETFLSNDSKQCSFESQKTIYLQNQNQQFDRCIFVDKLIQVNEEQTNNYQMIFSEKNDYILKKQNLENENCLLFKSKYHLNQKPETVYKLLHNLELRQKWDKIFSQWKVQKIINKNTDIIYSYLKAPILIDDRDWVQKRTIFENYRGYSYIILYQNYQSEEFPELKTCIRAQTLISGYLIQKGKCDSTILYGITMTDIKGNMPRIIINQYGKIFSKKWIKNLQGALQNYKNLNQNK